MSEEMKIEKVAVELLKPHPKNPRKDLQVDDLLESVRLHGVRKLLKVRELGDGVCEVLAGHRRLKAAQLLGLEELMCEVVEATDAEALVILVNDNLERLDLGPMDEAMGVKLLLEEAGLSEEAVAKTFSKSKEWVRLRQGLLGLPEDAQQAVREQTLAIGAAQLVLHLPAEDRAAGLQMILHPDFQIEPLNERQAADVIKRKLVNPRLERESWEAEKAAAVVEAREQLKKVANEPEDLMVRAASWEEVELIRKRGADYVSAEEAAPRAEAALGMDYLRWLDLAVRHGMGVLVIPDPSTQKGLWRAVVNTRVLVDAEKALGDHREREGEGAEVWLKTAEKPKPGLVGKQDEPEEEEESEWAAKWGRGGQRNEVFSGHGVSVVEGEGVVRIFVDRKEIKESWELEGGWGFFVEG